MICSIETCDRTVVARALCRKHYDRWWRTGTTDADERYSTPEESFVARIERRGECLLWTGAKTEWGYGRISVGGRIEKAHRYAWKREHGSIPDQMTVDHRYHCDPACVEITHLRLATKAQNTQNRAGARRGSRTGIRNVYTHKNNYRVVIAGKHYGTYTTATEASEVAEQKRHDIFGEYAGKG